MNLKIHVHFNYFLYYSLSFVKPHKLAIQNYDKSQVVNKSLFQAVRRRAPSNQSDCPKYG
jgi:hypothetical protein